jgi:hypothetical protein
MSLSFADDDDNNNDDDDILSLQASPLLCDEEYEEYRPHTPTYLVTENDPSPIVTYTPKNEEESVVREPIKPKPLTTLLQQKKQQIYGIEKRRLRGLPSTLFLSKKTDSMVAANRQSAPPLRLMTEKKEELEAGSSKIPSPTVRKYVSMTLKN